MVGQENSTPPISRIWFGLWTSDILRQQLHPLMGLTAKISMSQCYKFISIAAKLTAPLQSAYSKMIQTNISHQQLDNIHPDALMESIALQNSIFNYDIPEYINITHLPPDNTDIHNPEELCASHTSHHFFITLHFRYPKYY